MGNIESRRDILGQGELVHRYRLTGMSEKQGEFNMMEQGLEEAEGR